MFLAWRKAVVASSAVGMCNAGASGLGQRAGEVAIAAMSWPCVGGNTTGERTEGDHAAGADNDAAIAAATAKTWGDITLSERR